MTKDVFLSLSDELKLKMTSNQIFVSISKDDDITYQDIFSWLCDNTSAPFYMIDEKKHDMVKMWIYFYEETDFIAFKLRWA